MLEGTVILKRPDVLEEHIFSILRIEEQAMQETIKKLAPSMFLRNAGPTLNSMALELRSLDYLLSPL
jgi:hypothetical protein